jgi:transposase
MEAVHKRCSGLDVHKETVAACVVVSDAAKGVRKEIRTYNTTTRSLLQHPGRPV